MNNKWAIVVIIILLLLNATILFVFPKIQENLSERKPSNNTNESVDIKKTAEELMEFLTLNFPEELYGNKIKMDKTNMGDSFIAWFTYQYNMKRLNEEASKNAPDSYTEIYKPENSVLYDAMTGDTYQYYKMSADDFLVLVKKMWGEDVVYNHNVIDKEDCMIVKYDQTKREYNLGWYGCGSLGKIEIIGGKIVGAKETPNKIEVTRKVCYIKAEYDDAYNVKRAEFYAPINKTNLLTTYENNMGTFDDFYNDNIDKCDSYKYTFEKHDNEFYFSSIELLKDY